jgi:hypothetical protein
MIGRPQILLIIDGLDECSGAHEQCEVLHLLSTLVKDHRIPLLFLIASRPEPHIRNSFNSPDFQHTCHQLSLRDGDYDYEAIHDLVVFLHSGFAEILDKHPHTMAAVPRPWPSEDVVWKLASRADGQFIYAATVLKFIDDADCRPTTQLQVVLDMSDSTAFTDLDLLYQHILSTSKNVSLLLRIVGCILDDKENKEIEFSAMDLETLLFLHEGDVPLALHRMHSILNIPKSPLEPITLHHQSFRDFMLDKSRACQYHIVSAHVKLDLVRGYLRILNSLTTVDRYVGH